MKNKKIFFILLAIIVIFSFAMVACQSDNRNNSNYENSAYNGNEEVKDWMKDQASGKDYDYDDGGDYYCMGKNDTCPNKTNNKYDLYCSSCDPDGDNIEG